jgi:flagellin
MPNTVGGISVANNLLANTALLNLNRTQSGLGGLVEKLSSGLRVNTSADDPSGLAIAVNLDNQAKGFDTANLNVQDASNAATVADGALETVTTILQRIRSLAIEAANTITSATDRQALQAEVTQLLQEVNQIATTTNFNGQRLLDGSHAGYQPAVAPSATVLTNAQLSTYNTALQSSQLIAGISVNPASANPDATVELQITQTATGPRLAYTEYYSATGASPWFVLAPTLMTLNLGGVHIYLNQSFATTDVGETAFVKILQSVSANSNPNGPAFQFQAGADEGATIQVGLVSVSTSSLRIANVNLNSNQTNPFYIGDPPSPFLGAQDAIGQVDFAITQVNNARAALGAVISRLKNAANNNNIASVNLTSSESAIRDLNVGSATAEYNKDQLLSQIGTTVLAQSNTNAQGVLGLFH